MDYHLLHIIAKLLTSREERQETRAGCGGCLFVVLLSLFVLIVVGHIIMSS